ncbi:cytidylyltransferase domain-containing protein [Thalassobacillus sp. C254]|uniref:acylneuraminate cytidylyltransferase family protein n=1 Tax=Thalassobacillus sp. C254 TaxID=1225341 RepID=UPI0018DD31CD|nr:acylneuraminate cytidylyltransferase family protein [Thalassobacillus sp. C254]
MSEVLAVIPARGGSKRLPGKNIKLLHGVPLIEYTIKAANRSSYVDRCIVSTDDQNIATISKKAGAEVPFLRPAKLAMDHSPVMDTCLHALRYLQQTEKYEPDIFLLLQPTSPYVTKNILMRPLTCSISKMQIPSLVFINSTLPLILFINLIQMAPSPPFFLKGECSVLLQTKMFIVSTERSMHLKQHF